MVVMRSKTRFGFGLGVSSSSPSAAKASCNSRLTTVATEIPSRWANAVDGASHVRGDGGEGVAGTLYFHVESFRMLSIVTDCRLESLSSVSAKSR
jgi:hypothetical protein